MHPFSRKLPSHPGCHMALSRVPRATQWALLVPHFKYSSVSMSIPRTPQRSHPPTLPLLFDLDVTVAQASLPLGRSREGISLGLLPTRPHPMLLCSAGPDAWRPQAPLSVGFSRQESWVEQVAMPSSRGSSRPRDRTHVSCISCIGRRVFYCHAT